MSAVSQKIWLHIMNPSRKCQKGRAYIGNIVPLKDWCCVNRSFHLYWISKCVWGGGILIEFTAKVNSPDKALSTARIFFLVMLLLIRQSLQILLYYF